MTVLGHGWDDTVGYPAFRNVIINGAMQVVQRSTSVASISASGYYTADRFITAINSAGTWTQSVENDAPTGSGFRKSVKMLCTSADAALSSGDFLLFAQYLEGQDCQRFAKGTSSAKPFALSFWVKSNVTGTYIAELEDPASGRYCSQSYTISASATWQKVTLVFPADTTGVINNDNLVGFRLNFWNAGGSQFTSGTLGTSWHTTAANRAVGQTNLASATNNYWQITGVQLEAGSVATPFEFEPYETTLRKCMRYFETSYKTGVAIGTNQGAFPTIVNEVPFITSFGQADGWGGARTLFTVPKRTSAVVTVYDESGNINKAGQIVGSTGSSLTNPAVASNDKGFMVQTAGLTAGVAVKMVYHYTASAEL